MPGNSLFFNDFGLFLTLFLVFSALYTFLVLVLLCHALAESWFLGDGNPQLAPWYLNSAMLNYFLSIYFSSFVDGGFSSCCAFCNFKLVKLYTLLGSPPNLSNFFTLNSLPLARCCIWGHIKHHSSPLTFSPAF